MKALRVTDVVKPFRVVARVANRSLATKYKYPEIIWLGNEDGVSLRCPTDSETATFLERHGGGIKLTITVED